MWIYGDLPKGWSTKRIGDYATIITDYVANGSFASLAKNVTYKSEPDYAVLIRLTDFNNDYKGEFVYIDEHAYEFLAKSKLYGNEIIISNVGANVGTLFKCPKLDLKMSLAPNSIMLKTKGNDDFYYYWFTSKNGQHSLQSIVTGSAQPKFNKTNFRDLEVPVPPIDIQNKIAKYLLNIDNKILLNKQINDNLQQQAQAIYAEFCGEGTPAVLSDILTVCYGKNHKSLGDGEIPCYGSGGIMRYVDKPLYTGESVLIPRKGSLNNVMYVNEAFWTVDTMFYAQMKRPNVAKLAYFIVRNLDLAGMNVGSAVPSMTTTVLNAINIVLLSDDALMSFEKTVSPMFLHMKANNAESNRLAEIRDTLLPRLMSGELDVSDIDI